MDRCELAQMTNAETAILEFITAAEKASRTDVFTRFPLMAKTVIEGAIDKLLSSSALVGSRDEYRPARAKPREAVTKPQPPPAPPIKDSAPTTRQAILALFTQDAPSLTRKEIFEKLPERKRRDLHRSLTAMANTHVLELDSLTYTKSSTAGKRSVFDVTRPAEPILDAPALEEDANVVADKADAEMRTVVATFDVPKLGEANASQVGGTHYKDKAIQPWDYIAANGLGFFEGNAVTYLTRWRERGGVEDLHKARHYIDKLIEVETDG